MTTEEQSHKKTALHHIHTQLGAKMVEFAGFHMPVVYSTIMEEHRCVRKNAGIFDVSHMGEFIVTGDNALDLIQKVTINDASNLEVGQVQYSAMCYPDGGIVDDLLIYRFEDRYMIVVNASNIEKDFNWITSNPVDGAKIENRSDSYTLLAVQGPQSLDIVQKISGDDLSGIKYYRAISGEIGGRPMIISRTGYTGETGVELYMDTVYSEQIWTAVMKHGEEFDIKPIGLGARDTLRLEKKMCLYGNDITKDTNPLEAGLGWITKLEKGDFIGRDALVKIKEAGLKRKLVAFESTTRAVPRHGYELVLEGETIGEVTSGTFSPILEKGIGLGYVTTEHAKTGTELFFKARGKEHPCVIIKPPFV
ncbi:glycine cleavage system aminomethyltransferase GcvT [candidate division KSB1 bacterium]